MPDGMMMLQRSESIALFQKFERYPPRRPLFADPERSTADRHPWLTAFERAPEQGITDLLAGYAEIGALGRLNPPEAAYALFNRLEADDPARQSLTPAIMAWLDKRRRQPPPEPAPKRQRWIAEIQDAFAIVHLLELVPAAIVLRRSVATWNIVTGDLVVSPSRDARAGFWWMLALTQPLVARAAPDINPFGLVPHWLAVCENAGGALPKHYLDIGLMGLRRLPDGETASVVPWMTGLAVWASAQRPTEAAFSAQWLGLKLQYPRTPNFWRDCVAEVLDDPMFAGQGLAAPAWWVCDPELR
jgi:hypothetical protein